MNDLTHRQYARSIQKTEPTERLYIALDNYDLSFYPAEVDKIKKMWVVGEPVPNIAQIAGREIEEVFVLLLDLVLQHKIKARPGGIYAMG